MDTTPRQAGYIADNSSITGQFSVVYMYFLIMSLKNNDSLLIGIHFATHNSANLGISLMHDEGTGGNTAGGYGIFPLFPLSGCDFESCPVGLDARKALRAAGTDGE